MQRRDFLARLSGLAAAGLAGSAIGPRPLPAAGNTPKNMNALFIVCDDLRPELACYGDAGIKTPNIDKLAAQGTLFTHAYCQQAICAASRASFLSGLRPDTTSIYDLEHPLRKTKPEVVTLPQIFREAGYETVTIGKIYHHPNDDKQSWTHMPWLGHKNPTYVNPETLAAQGRKQAEAKAKGLSGVQAYNYAAGPPTECADVADNAYGDGMVAEMAVAQLRELKDKPFLMCVGFQKPHLPFCAPRKYWDLYNREVFAVPERKPPAGMPEIAGTNWDELRSYTDIPKQKAPLDDAKSRELIHGYHAAVSFVDAQIGKVLDELEALGLKERTAVILIGDHGWKLGEYGMWCKHTNLEYDTRVPLIARVPGGAAGARCEALVEFVDILPTFADACGVQAPAACEGVSFRPLLAEPGRAWKRAAFSQYPRGANIMGYSVRSGPWRYTEWRGRDKDGKLARVIARELYDQGGGPFAPENLADKPEHAATVKELAEVLRAGWQAARPE